MELSAHGSEAGPVGAEPRALQRLTERASKDCACAIGWRASRGCACAMGWIGSATSTQLSSACWTASHRPTRKPGLQQGGLGCVR